MRPTMRGLTLGSVWLLGGCEPATDTLPSPIDAPATEETPADEPLVRGLVGDLGLVPSSGQGALAPGALEEEPPPLDTAADLVVDVDHVPECAILEPADGSAFHRGTSIYFEAELYDADGDDLRTIWSSDLYGAMVLGNGFGFILPPGRHVVQVEVRDAAGNLCIDDVIVQVLQN